MGEHSLLNPSGAKQRALCPGSLAQQAFAGGPDIPSEYAAEGTAAHELAEWCLSGDKDARAFLGRNITVEEKDDQGKVHRFRFTVDDEMARHVQKYLDAVRELAQGAPIFAEVRLHHGEMIDMHDNLAWGTSDAVVIVDDEIQVHDLKYGKGVPVSPVENLQAIAYALGAYAWMEQQFGAEDLTTVRVFIHQVRSDTPLLEWAIPVADLLNVYRPQLQASEHEAHRLHRLAEVGMHIEPQHFVPGEEQCRFCRAKATCPALRRHVAREVADDFEVLDDPKPLTKAQTVLPQDLPIEADTINALLAAHMASVPVIRQWCDSIEAAGTAVALRGGHLPGFKVVQGKKGNRAWANATAAEDMLKSMRLKQNEMYDMKLISPTKAEELLAETPKRWNKVKTLITQADGKPTVVPASDKRAALVIEPVTDDFADLDAEGLATDDLC